ncbi:MAG TPA: aldo/keto reductase [Candidatus Ozemobacteraceae bacterium]|nr:aldo/keto reductase [Candidatus Ozemobacteraceae bacterium]
MLERRKLGTTGIEVSRLGLGTLTMSPLQRGLEIEAGGDLILAAFDAGIRFVDTAQMYGSYPQVASALHRWKGERITIASKSAAKTEETMKQAVDEALTTLGLPFIDVFLLHAVRDQADFQGREGALAALLDAKKSGKVRAIGASSHFVGMMRLLAADPRLDVLHPMLNRDGFGIIDEPLSAMLDVLAGAKRSGKGVYAMKPLGGGHLRNEAKPALEWLLGREEADAMVVGMTSIDELRMNISIASGIPVDPEIEKRAAGQKRNLFINEALCRHCGRCIEVCQQHALTFREGRNAPVIDASKCVVCGYCAPGCPAFAIRII